MNRRNTVQIICDSVSPDGVRITTFVCTFWRLLLAEWNTHRVFSRNAASSRAIPSAKMIEAVLAAPFVPWHWPAEQKGMQGGPPLGYEEQRACRAEWLAARDDAVKQARRLKDLGLHKSIGNRLLEPFMWASDVVTSTEWDNFFNLRAHEGAEPHFADLAFAMAELYFVTKPVKVDYGEWHLPFIQRQELDSLALLGPGRLKAEQLETLKRVSAARCARVSYTVRYEEESAGTGVEAEPRVDRDLARYDKLVNSRPVHASPFEHVATPHEAMFSGIGACRNFRGWVQFRGEIPEETCWKFTEDELDRRIDAREAANLALVGREE